MSVCVCVWYIVCVCTHLLRLCGGQSIHQSFLNSFSIYFSIYYLFVYSFIHLLKHSLSLNLRVTVLAWLACKQTPALSLYLIIVLYYGSMCPLPSCFLCEIQGSALHVHDYTLSILSTKQSPQFFSLFQFNLSQWNIEK